MKKWILFSLSLLLLMGCDDHIQVLFQKAMTGRSAIRLEGKYLFPTDKEVEEAILHVKSEGQKKYLFTLESQEKDKPLQMDTLYHGEMVRRGQDYFLNIPSKNQDGYWKIRSFRLENDTAYNLFEALIGSQKEVLLDHDYFSHYEMVQGETEQDTIYFVQNRMRETLKAFRHLHEQTDDVFYLPKLETTQTEAQWMEEKPLLELVSIYPNPFIDELTIKALVEEPLLVQLFDVSGQIIEEQQMKSTEQILNLSDLPYGIYIMKIYNQSGTAHQSLKLSKSL